MVLGFSLCCSASKTSHRSSHDLKGRLDSCLVVPADSKEQETTEGSKLERQWCQRVWQVRGTYREVALVADQHDGHVGVGVLPGILQPAGEMVEGFPPAQIAEA